MHLVWLLSLYCVWYVDLLTRSVIVVDACLFSFVSVEMVLLCLCVGFLSGAAVLFVVVSVAIGVSIPCMSYMN